MQGRPLRQPRYRPTVVECLQLELRIRRPHCAPSPVQTRLLDHCLGSVRLSVADRQVGRRVHPCDFVAVAMQPWVAWRDEEGEIARSRPPLPRSRHQRRHPLASPIQSEPARHRGIAVLTRRDCQRRDNPLLVRRIRRGLRPSGQGGQLDNADRTNRHPLPQSALCLPFCQPTR